MRSRHKHSSLPEELPDSGTSHRRLPVEQPPKLRWGHTHHVPCCHDELAGGLEAERVSDLTDMLPVATQGDKAAPYNDGTAQGKERDQEISGQLARERRGTQTQRPRCVLGRNAGPRRAGTVNVRGSRFEVVVNEWTAAHDPREPLRTFACGTRGKRGIRQECEATGDTHEICSEQFRRGRCAGEGVQEMRRRRL